MNALLHSLPPVPKGKDRAAALLQKARANQATGRSLWRYLAETPYRDLNGALAEKTVAALEAATALLTTGGGFLPRTQRDVWEKQLDALEASIRVNEAALAVMRAQVEEAFMRHIDAAEKEAGDGDGSR